MIATPAPIPSAPAVAPVAVAPEVAAPAIVTPTAFTPAVASPPAAPPPADLQNALADLQNQLRQALADRALLAAKLKEATSVQPAAADPQELNRAQEEIRVLQKETALFQTSLEEVRAKQARAEVETAASDSLRRQLADAQQKADELAHVNSELMTENAGLAAQIKQPVTTSAATKALREENDVLKKKVAELSRKSPASDVDLNGKLSESQARVAALESDLDLLRLERTALEDRVKTMSATATVSSANPATGGADADRIKALEAERDGLQQRLDAALSQLAAGKTSREAAQVDETSRALADLRARIDILEAHPVPYTQDELALISPPGVTLLAAATHSSGRKSPGELPARAAALLSEAKRDVANHDLDKAELKYLDILKFDEKNIATLADLASIQVDLDHLGDADQHLAAALAIEPDNEYSLFVLGRLRFKQQKFDDALDALSRAAQLNPDNAEIQNYLGITLSEKGLRGPAEAALRKALQIDPGYGGAHVNLAFIYLTQQPPLTELARWHYEKAIAAGYPANPAIEKLLAAPKSPTPPGTP
jgi:tetratricopeptide (TPR) repeat protein